MIKEKFKNKWRKLDNTAKIFSLDDKKNINIFRYSVILKEEVDEYLLELAVKEALIQYPAFKVKMKTGLFWNYLEESFKIPMVEKEQKTFYGSSKYHFNNDYLFKVTYFSNKINLDIFHVLTDGLGAIFFLKSILYQYLNLKYKLTTKEKLPFTNIKFNNDEYLNNVDKKIFYKEKEYKRVFMFHEKTNLLKNKSFHYILDLDKTKIICKDKQVTITEFLTAVYLYAIYKTSYYKIHNKDIIITIPIDLRKYYQVQTLSNFFTCMKIKGNVSNQKYVFFDNILKQVQEEFQKKLTFELVKKYLSQDVRLGTNLVVRFVPLFIKKIFIRNLGKLFMRGSTTTLSNVGVIKVEEQYKKYIENIVVLANPGSVQRVKCTVCSYENKLTVTLNSNLINDCLEKEFAKLLIKYIGNVKIENNI